MTKTQSVKILLTDHVHWSHGFRSTWVCIHVDFQNLENALPPGSEQGNSGFTVEHLTLSRSLPLVHHYKETAAPQFSFSQVTIVMRPRKARAVGLDLNSVAVETLHSQTWVGAGQ